MTEHREWFSTFRPIALGTWSVTVADDRDLWVQGVGDINITRLVDGVQKKGVLQNVLSGTGGFIRDWSASASYRSVTATLSAPYLVISAGVLEVKAVKAPDESVEGRLEETRNGRRIDIRESDKPEQANRCMNTCICGTRWTITEGCWECRIDVIKGSRRKICRRARNWWTHSSSRWTQRFRVRRREYNVLSGKTRRNRLRN
jgi:hypothetical protein